MAESALLTDLYELNMAASYLRRGMEQEATFSLFVRTLPPNRGFLVAAGLEPCLDFLEGFGFPEGDLDYLGRELGFDDDVLDAFGALRFRGEVWAVPEGRVVHAGEPLLEITAPIAVAQLVEPFLLNQITFQTTIASKAARCVIAADGRDVVDFSLRRTQGLDAAINVARVSAIVGFVATSNVEAARRFGLRVAGTMAHSYIESFPNEAEAFRTFAQDLPEPHDVPRRHLRHDQRRPHGDRRDPRARASRATSASGSTAATSPTLARESPSGARRRPGMTARAGLRERRPRRVLGRASSSEPVRRSTRSGSARGSASRRTRRRSTPRTSSSSTTGGR